MDRRSFKESLRIEPNLVVKKDDKFAPEPLCNVLFFLTSNTFKSLLLIITHLKLDRNLLGFRRVIVAPDYEILAWDALELFLPSFDFRLRTLKDRVDRGIYISIFVDSKLGIRALMRIE